MKKFLWILFGLYLVFGAGFLIYENYTLERDLDALIDRAQVGADREDVTDYLTQLKTNMEKRGCTKGHTALIFKTAINDMSLHYRSINKVLDRLESIKDIPKNETAYQVALDDIRGIVRELPNPAAGLLWVRYIWWMTLIAIVLLVFALIYDSETLLRILES